MDPTCRADVQSHIPTLLHKKSQAADPQRRPEPGEYQPTNFSRDRIREPILRSDRCPATTNGIRATSKGASRESSVRAEYLFTAQNLVGWCCLLAYWSHDSTA